MSSETCSGCGNPLPADVLCSISHTIDPGAKLCSDCGQKETLEPGWAEGRRVGYARHKAPTEGMENTRKIIGDK